MAEQLKTITDFKNAAVIEPFGVGQYVQVAHDNGTITTIKAEPAGGYTCHTRESYETSFDGFYTSDCDIPRVIQVLRRDAH